jgi:hypothetical protein
MRTTVKGVIDEEDQFSEVFGSILKAWVSYESTPRYVGVLYI